MSLLDEPTEIAPQPGRHCWHEAAHALISAHFNRLVGRVTVSRFAQPCAWRSDAEDDLAPARAIRQDIDITLAGRLGEIFYSHELDEKLEKTLGVVPHERQLRSREPLPAELELIGETASADPLADPLNDDAQVMDLLDRLELLEPGLDRALELREREGETAELLIRHEQAVRDVAGLLRDQTILEPGTVNAIFDFNTTEQP